MAYIVSSDSATKIAESSGTIQNADNGYSVEVSNSPDFSNKILLFPNEKFFFSGTDIFLRCHEQGMSVEVNVVPFSVDVKGGDSSSAIGSDSDAFKAVSFVDNTLKFYTSTDTDTAQAAASIDIPAEQFLDQANTNFVHNFLFSAILYPGATNPNLDGKPVLVLAIKSKNNDGILFDVSYKFLDLSSLLDSYISSDTSVVISDYKVKVNISSDNGNFLSLKSNGLFVDGMTDTATTTSNGLMSAADKVKLDGVDTDSYATKTELASKLDSDATLDFATKDDLTGYVEKVTGKVLSTNDFTDAYKSKLDGVATDSYVVKVAGKDLSSNDFTTAEKNKLTNIADSAQVNVIESVKVNNTELVISNKAVNIDLANASVKSAASLNSAKSLKVSLASSNAQSFDGSDNATVIGVGGILPTVYGGTGNASGTVSGAAKLNTAQNFITNLASTVAGSFNGTASVSAGVTGILPVANGGTGQSDLNNVTVGGANRDGAGNVITDTYVTKTEFTRGTAKVWRFGYRIKNSEADPYERVEYLFDAVGMTPAKMVYDTDTDTAATSSDKGYFDYGSWRDVWFVRDNKPLMLKYDGTVDYYLDPNDYSKKENGTASDVANTDYGGNAMMQIPLVWVKRYTEGDYLYEIVSNVKYDDDYYAYAHTDKYGNIKDYCYHAIFGGSGSTSKIRSLSGQNLIDGSKFTSETCIPAARANGSGWDFSYWSQYCLIRTLLVLMGKSTDLQAVYGTGTWITSTDHEHFQTTTGELNDKGQFFGFNSNTRRVKVFHTECFWGELRYRMWGITSDNWNIYVKMTPEGAGYQYGVNSPLTGYTYVATFPAYSSDSHPYIKTATCSKFGIVPTAGGASSSTYFCDQIIMNSTTWKVIALGANTDAAFSLHTCYGYNEYAKGAYALLTYV